MIPDSISISRFARRGANPMHCYEDQLIVTDSVENVEQFRSPCRIDAITVLVCLGGEAEYSINLRRYHVCADTIVVNFPGDVIQVHRAEQLRAYAVLMSSDYLSSLKIDFRERSDFYVSIHRNAVEHVPHGEIAALEPYYRLLKTNIEAHRPESRAVLSGLVQAFSYSIISLMRLCRGERDDAHAEEATYTRGQQIFDKFMALLKTHHTRERSVSFYAGEMCLTPNYMSGLVRDYSGRPAAAWINDYVILEARILLADRDLSIQEVACRLNFPSQSAFGKYFKQQTGMGPREYRSGTEKSITKTNDIRK